MFDRAQDFPLDLERHIELHPNAKCDLKALISTLVWMNFGDWDDMALEEIDEEIERRWKLIFP